MCDADPLSILVFREGSRRARERGPVSHSQSGECPGSVENINGRLGLPGVCCRVPVWDAHAKTGRP